MDEAEKCTDLAYINLGALLYSGKTRDIIPFSQVKSYLVQADREAQHQLVTLINQEYPTILATFVNNDLRVSSRDIQALNALLQCFSGYVFSEVMPNFEEVFIGLIPA